MEYVDGYRFFKSQFEKGKFHIKIVLCHKVGEYQPLLTIFPSARRTLSTLWSHFLFCGSSLRIRFFFFITRKVELYYYSFYLVSESSFNETDYF